MKTAAPRFNRMNKIATSAFFADPLGILAHALAELGDVFSFQLFGEENLFMISANAARHILIEHPSSFAASEGNLVTGKELFGNAFIYLDGAEHTRKRHSFAPSFGARVDESLDARVAAVIEECLPPGPSDIGRISNAMFLRIAGLKLLRFDLGIDAAYVSRLLIELASGLYSDPSSRQTDGVYAVAMQAKAHLIEFWQARTEQLEYFRVSLGLQGDRDSFIAEVTDDLNAILWAGFDTCSAVFAFAIEYIGGNFGLLDRLKSASNSSLECNRILYSTLSNSIFYETLRLRPPVYLISRRATQASVVDGIRIRDGQLINLVPILLQRSPHYYDRSEYFDPDRFVNGVQGPTRDGYFIPFGSGPKTCIGASIGKWMFRLALDHLIDRDFMVSQPRTTLRWIPGLASLSGPGVEIP